MREIKFRAWDDVRIQYFDLRNGYPANWTGWKNVMQYTGLKDKNGKEIYEGDILMTGAGAMPIEWNETDASWSFNGLGSMVSIASDGARFPLYQWLEIIGNIYENPELSNAKT